MNADDKANWLKPSPPIAVDGEPTRADHSEPGSRLEPEILASDRAAEVLSRPTRVDAVRMYVRRAFA
jgi:hypothetical protein